MKFKFEVEVEVNRVQGKFASRDEIAEQITEALEGADPGQYEGGEGGEYETASWDVNEIIPVRHAAPRKTITVPLTTVPPVSGEKKGGDNV